MSKYTENTKVEQYLPAALWTDVKTKNFADEVQHLAVDHEAFIDVRRLFMIILRLSSYARISTTRFADLIECLFVNSRGSTITKLFLDMYFYRFNKKDYLESTWRQTIKEHWCTYGRFNRDSAIDRVCQILAGTSHGLDEATLFYLLRHPTPDFDWFFLEWDDGCNFELDPRLNVPSTFVASGSRFLIEQGLIFYSSRT